MSVILKASTKGPGPGQRADYLLHNPKNEQVRVFDIRGTASPDNAYDSIVEMGMYAQLTRSNNPYLQIAINFDDAHPQSDAEWKHLLDRIDKTIGFEDQARVAVMHKYQDKWHMHLTYGRYDHDTGLMKPVDHIGLKLKGVSYEHAIEHDHENLLKWQEIKRQKEIEEKQKLEAERLANEQKKKLIEAEFAQNLEEVAKKPEIDKDLELFYRLRNKSSQGQERGFSY